MTEHTEFATLQLFKIWGSHGKVNKNVPVDSLDWASKFFPAYV